MVDLSEVQCPTCFEFFHVAHPPEHETPCEVDYDCEVCCRPMVISFDQDGAFARSLDDA